MGNCVHKEGPKKYSHIDKKESPQPLSTQQSRINISIPRLPSFNSESTKTAPRLSVSSQIKSASCMFCKKQFSIMRRPVRICQSDHHLCFFCIYIKISRGELSSCPICCEEVEFSAIQFNEQLLKDEGLYEENQLQPRTQEAEKEIPSDIGLRETFKGLNHYAKMKERERRHIFREAYYTPSLFRIMREKIPFNKVKVLNLSSCELSCIPVLEDFEVLEILHMNNNNIQKIDPLENLSLLIDLGLAHNSIKKLENINLEELMYLDLSYNKIEQIENLQQQICYGMQNLKQLCLQENPLSQKTKNLLSESRDTRLRFLY